MIDAWARPGGVGGLQRVFQFCFFFFSFFFLFLRFSGFYYYFYFLKLFYCCSSTVVCIYPPPLPPPTPAIPTSLPCFHPLWFWPCVLYSCPGEGVLSKGNRIQLICKIAIIGLVYPTWLGSIRRSLSVFLSYVFQSFYYLSNHVSFFYPHLRICVLM